jgi:adenine-specific DNA-methyltransferase
MSIEKINKIIKTDIRENLRNVFPEVFEDNKINFEKLKALLSGGIIEAEDDRFYFNWAGKSNLYKLIQAPAYGTLKPDKERSVDFDKTENIVIVGENLETLKLLLKPYFGKVKMIYIDPPYNTGKDFIYRDNFKQPLKDYLEKTGQIDSEGKKLTTNTEASGRYHSDWLNFIYPRLFLARSLLRDDGVIFVSIDDNEVHHLRMIMDEIFGEENFVISLCWKSRHSISNDALISTNHNYNLVYVKNIKAIQIPPIFRMLPDEDYKSKFTNPDNDPRGPWIDVHIEISGVHVSKGLIYEIYDKVNNIKYLPKEGACWRFSKDTFEKMLNEGKIIFSGDPKIKPRYKFFLKDAIITPSSWLDRVGTTTDGTNEIKQIFGKILFSNPKPIGLIKYLLRIVTSFEKDCIILDFFAGSGTTGHAVWDLNKEDEGNRKFILVQLDEEVQDEEIKKEFPTVADICIERLRRVSEKYKKENTNQDFGFKVFRLDKSNFNLKDEFEFDPSEDKEELKKKYLEWLGMWVNEPLVQNWKEIDVIYEVMLKEGLNLNSKIEKVKIKDDEFYYVKDEEQNLDFYISFKDKFSQDTIEEIRTSKYKGKMFVFLDKALTDSDKINLSAFVRLKVI